MPLQMAVSDASPSLQLEVVPSTSSTTADSFVRIRVYSSASKAQHSTPPALCEDGQQTGVKADSSPISHAEDDSGIPAWFRDSNAKGTGVVPQDWQVLNLKVGEGYPAVPPISEFTERAADSNTSTAEAVRDAFHTVVGELEGPLTVSVLGEVWQARLADV